MDDTVLEQLEIDAVEATLGLAIDSNKAALLQVDIAAEDYETRHLKASLRLIDKEFTAVTIILDMQLALLVYGTTMPYMSEEQLEDIVTSKKLAWITKNMPAISELTIPWSIVTGREQSLQQAKNDNILKIRPLLQGKKDTALLKIYLADIHNITEAQYKNDTDIDHYLISHIATIEAMHFFNEYAYIYIARYSMDSYSFLQQTSELENLPQYSTLKFTKNNAKEISTNDKLNEKSLNINLINEYADKKYYLENPIKNFPGPVYIESLNRTFSPCDKQPHSPIGAKDEPYFAGKNFESFSSQDEADKLAKIVEEITSTNTTKTLIENPHYLRNKLPFLSIKMLLRNKKNKSVGILGFSMQLEDKNHTHNIATLRETIENMPGQAFWQNTHGQILGCNRNQAKFLGFDSPEDLIGKYPIDFLTEKHAKGEQQSIREIIATGKAIIKEEIYKSASNFMVMISHKIPVKDNNGKVIGIIAVSFDISEIRQDEIQLEQEKEKLSAVKNFEHQFAQTIEHDMRNSFIELCNMTEACARKENNLIKKNNLYDISSCAKDLINYCDSLLDFNAVENYSNNKNLVSIKDLITSIVNTHADFIESKNLDFELCYDNNIPKEVIGDSYRIKKILASLVKNAARHTDQGYIKLVITLESYKNSSPTISFKIIDSGIGINKDNKQHTVTKDCSSSGKCICLNEIKLFVEDLGGTIHIESGGLAGSSITVTLNFDMPNIMNNKTLASATPFLEEITTELDCYSKPTTKGITILNTLKDEHFDILLLDIGLEDTDGYTLARKIRLLELRQRQQPVKIIIMTSQQAKLQSGLAKELNITDYFIEPAQVKDLTNTIKNCMLEQ